MLCILSRVILQPTRDSLTLYMYVCIVYGILYVHSIHVVLGSSITMCIHCAYYVIVVLWCTTLHVHVHVLCFRSGSE